MHNLIAPDHRAWVKEDGRALLTPSWVQNHAANQSALTKAEVLLLPSLRVCPQHQPKALVPADPSPTQLPAGCFALAVVSMHVRSLNPVEMPAAPEAPALALPADANQSGAARLLLLLSLQPSSQELPRPLGSSPPAGSPWGCPCSPTLNGTTQSLAGASGVRRPSEASCHQAITLQRKKLFHPSRETSSQEPPAKCLYQGAGEEEGRGWKRLTLPGVGHSNLFRALRPAEREKCLLQHELVQFIIVLAYLRSIAAGRPDPTGGTGHPAPGLRGFHLQSQQVLGCIPLLRLGSARGVRRMPGLCQLHRHLPKARWREPVLQKPRCCPGRTPAVRRGDAAQRHPAVPAPRPRLRGAEPEPTAPSPLKLGGRQGHAIAACPRCRDPPGSPG